MRLNIFKTDTETFFRDQYFRDRDRYSQKIEKSLDTEKSRDEMSHSVVIDKAILQNIDIDKISNRFKFGISNRAMSEPDY